MASIAGLLVRSRPGTADEVRALLRTTEGVEIVKEEEGNFAVVLEAARPAEQEAIHESIAALAPVEQALLVFQSTPVEESES